MTDFNKVKIHCSTIYTTMADGRAKSNMDLYLEACEELSKKQSYLDLLKKKDGIMGIRAAEAIKKLEIAIPILELAKDMEQPLSKGCKTLLSGLYAFHKYHKWNPFKDIGNRATEKGLVCEPEGIELVNKYYGLSLYKNEHRIENEWFSGLPDCIEKVNDETIVIHDIKCPENIESFFSYLDSDEPPIQYYWQMQGYMDLTGADEAKVHFCLVNSPLHQIQKSANNLLARMEVVSELDTRYVEAEKQLIMNLTYDDIPEKDKIITFTVKRNDDDIQRARRKAERCREYLIEFEKKHLHLQ